MAAWVVFSRLIHVNYQPQHPGNKAQGGNERRTRQKGRYCRLVHVSSYE